MLSRQLGDKNIDMHNGSLFQFIPLNYKGIWKKTSTKCNEIRGKKLGIVGYGHIGTQLSVLAEGN